jgi:hypothetical protein
MTRSKDQIIQEMQALLEMIAPSDDYKGGQVSYFFAKELLDYTKQLKAERDRLADKLELEDALKRHDLTRNL